MQNAELNAALAVELNGWVDGDPSYGDWWWLPDGTHPHISKRDWNPAERIEQAMECVKQMTKSDFLFEVSGPYLDTYWCAVHRGTNDEGTWDIRSENWAESFEQIPYAISLACLEAKRKATPQGTP